MPVRIEKTVEQLLTESGAPRLHTSFRPSDNTSEEWAEAYERIKAETEKGSVCAILGTNGNGKTQCAVCCMGHAIYNLKKKARYSKALDVFLLIREANSRNSETSERQAVEEFVSPWLLVIDAFEVRGESAFENRILNHIIDKRYDLKRPTIIISNDTGKKFADVVGSSIIDRMKAGNGVVVMRDASRRANK